MNFDRLKFRVWNEDKNQYNSDLDKDWIDAISFDGDIYNINPATNDCGLGGFNNRVIEQSTGLKDTNGKLIYEGDVIFINGEKWQVIWNDEDCAFFFSNLKETYHQPIFPDFYMMASDFEVIGNIHENKELLK